MPKRIQRMRTKNWRAPGGAVYVGRPSQWGNPFTLNEYRDIEYELGWIPKASGIQAREHVAAEFQKALLMGTIGDYPSVEEIREELAGRDLMCWCSLDDACHADTLLSVANTEGT